VPSPRYFCTAAELADQKKKNKKKVPNTVMEAKSRVDWVQNRLKYRSKASVHGTTHHIEGFLSMHCSNIWYIVTWFVLRWRNWYHKKNKLPQFWVFQQTVLGFCSSHQKKHFGKRNKFSGYFYRQSFSCTKVVVARCTAPYPWLLWKTLLYRLIKWVARHLQVKKAVSYGK
jgi:hypothetical protein